MTIGACTGVWGRSGLEAAHLIELSHLHVTGKARHSRSCLIMTGMVFTACFSGQERSNSLGQ